ncbi:MAG: ABC transporter ATP-binding protein [Pseudomonadota bacterium]
MNAAGPPALAVAGLGVGHGGRMVLEAVTEGFDGGAITAVIGGNGSGKSTLLRALAGIDRPLAGSVQIDGEAVTRPATRRRIGYLPQRTAVLAALTVEAQLGYAARLAGVRDVATAVADSLSRWDLGAVATRPAEHLSPGVLRRVGLAMAVIAEPPVLVLDEPHSGIDAVGSARLDEYLEDVRDRSTIVHATHDPDAALLTSDRVVLLRGARLEPVPSAAPGGWSVVPEGDAGAPPGALAAEVQPRDDGERGWIVRPAAGRVIADVLADLVVASIRIERVVPMAEERAAALRRLVGDGP